MPFAAATDCFAALLAAELAVVCALAAGLFGAPYKLALTSGDFYKHPAPTLPPRTTTA